MAAAQKTITEKDVKGKTFVAKAEAVVINLGTAAERYLYKHAVLPAETKTEELVRLLTRGLIEEQPKAETPAEGAQAETNGTDQTGSTPAGS
jgi:hypothetical protein